MKQSGLAAMISVILLAFLLQGCVAAMMGKAIDQGQNLTPEQIKAYSDVGSAVYGCFNLSGPPPAGGTTWVVLPKNSDAFVTFLPNCMVQMR